jgi:SNF2 family DNA or RNA helicase
MAIAHVSEKHKVFVLPYDAALYNLVTGCKPVKLPSGDHLVIPHTVETTKLARNLGHRVPAPILSQYDWAGGSPFLAQEITAALMTMNPRAFILSEIGTGKTRASLFAIDWLLREGIIKSALIAAPLSTLSQVWDREIFQYFPHLTTAVLHGTRKQRLELLAKGADIYIINHDGIEVIEKELCANSGIGCVVIDELSYYRNGTTDRWKSMSKLVAGRQYVWGLTGSPTPNEPADAYSQIKLLRPEAVPKYYKHFKELVMTQYSNFRWVAKPTALETVYNAMQPGVRYLRKDIMELPPTSYQTRDCALTLEQGRVYKALYDKAHYMHQHGEITALNAGVLMSKLLQVSGGWVYSTARGIISFDNSPRVDALLALLEEVGEGRVIVFVEFIHAVTALYSLLKSKGISCETVTGATSLPERNRIFGAFQAGGGARVLVAHPKCMSHGLTLTAASTVCWFIPTTSLETYEQANGRITRPGQVNKTLIVHLCGSAVERKIYGMLQKKGNVQDSLLSMFADAVQP